MSPCGHAAVTRRGDSPQAQQHSLCWPYPAQCSHPAEISTEHLLSVCESQPSTAKALLPMVPRVCFPLEGTAEGPHTPKHTGQLPKALETHYKLFCSQLKCILTWFVLFICKKTTDSCHCTFCLKNLRFKLIKKVTEFSCAQRKKTQPHAHTPVFGEISTLQSADSISKPNHSPLGKGLNQAKVILVL